MRTIVVITQRVDQSHDVLGFFIDWLIEMSRIFDRVEVITLSVGVYQLPPNVFIHPLDGLGSQPTSRWKRAWRFCVLATKLVPVSHGVFAHMSPIFAIAIWPWTVLLQKRLVLWYLHRAKTLRLRLAYALSHRLVTAEFRSLTIQGSKIVSVGHGIHVSRFKTQRTWDHQPDDIHLVSVGRISPIKRFEIAIEAVDILRKAGANCILTIVGRPILPADYVYAAALRKLIHSRTLETAVSFAGVVPYSDTPSFYAAADININMSPTGGLDKSVLEGMAAGCLVITSNGAFADTLGTKFQQMIIRDTPQSLADAVIRFVRLSREEKKSMSDGLVRRVSEQHDLRTCVHRIARLFDQ